MNLVKCMKQTEEERLKTKKWYLRPTPKNVKVLNWNFKKRKPTKNFVRTQGIDIYDSHEAELLQAYALPIPSPELTTLHPNFTVMKLIEDFLASSHYKNLPPWNELLKNSRFSVSTHRMKSGDKYKHMAKGIIALVKTACNYHEGAFVNLRRRIVLSMHNNYSEWLGADLIMDAIHAKEKAAKSKGTSGKFSPLAYAGIEGLRQDQRQFEEVPIGYSDILKHPNLTCKLKGVISDLIPIYYTVPIEIIIAFQITRVWFSCGKISMQEVSEDFMNSAISKVYIEKMISQFLIYLFNEAFHMNSELNRVKTVKLQSHIEACSTIANEVYNVNNKWKSNLRNNLQFKQSLLFVMRTLENLIPSLGCAVKGLPLNADEFIIKWKSDYDR